MNKITVLFLAMLISTLSLVSNASAFSMSFHDLRLSAWSGLSGLFTLVHDAHFSSHNNNNFVVDFESMRETENIQPESFQIPFESMRETENIQPESFQIPFESISETENIQPESFQIPEDVENTQEYVDLDPTEIDTPSESSTPVPEPASMLLLGLGISGLAAFKRAKTKNRV